MVLSVIIPVYNAVAYIGYCLNSLFEHFKAGRDENGEICDFEIVIVDDGSTDDSMKRIEEWKKSHPSCHIQTLSQNHKGAASARNLGIEKANGDWLWMVDADDLVAPNATSVLMDLLPHYPAHLIKVGKLQSLTKDKRNVPPCKANLTNTNPHLTDTYFEPQSGCLDHTTYIFKKDFLIENGLKYPTGMTILEDSIFMLKVFQIFPFIDYNPTLNFYYVRKHKGSTTRTQWNKDTYGPYMNDVGLFFDTLAKTLTDLCDSERSSAFWSRYVYVYLRVLAVKGVPWNLLKQFRKQVFEGDHGEIRYLSFPLRYTFMRNRITYRFFHIFCKIYKKIF